MIKKSKKVVVFYHDRCLDGFTSAYYAYKKYKNKADYIPLKHGTHNQTLKEHGIPISKLRGKVIYFLDFCLEQDEMDKVLGSAKKVVVLDHHVGVQDIVENIKGSVFGDGVSGAYLSHRYFFPKERTPRLAHYVSIGDTYSFSKNKRTNGIEQAILSYLHVFEFDFAVFRRLEKELEDRNKIKEIIEKGKLLRASFAKMLERQIGSAREIKFDKHKVLAINASGVFRSHLGHELAKRTGTFGIVYKFADGILKLSLRGVGKIDLSKLAKKYGGGGHFNAAGISLTDKKQIQKFIDQIIK